MNTKVLVKEIVDFLGDSLIGIKGAIDGVCVDNVADVEHCNETTLDWINPIKKEKQTIAETSKAKVVVADSGVEYSELMIQQGKTLLIS